MVKYASYYVNPEGRFILVITNDEADAFAPITKMKNVMVAGSVVVLIILVCAGCIVIRNLVKPLHVLTGVVDKIAELDFTKDAREEKLASRKDEIGLISKSINNLHSELTDIISIIQKQEKSFRTVMKSLQKDFQKLLRVLIILMLLLRRLQQEVRLRRRIQVRQVIMLPISEMRLRQMVLV